MGRYVSGLLISVLLLAPTALLLPTSAIATDAGPVTQKLDWADSNKYKECGQSCLYSKSNETLSLDSLYTVEKLEYVEKSLDVVKKTCPAATDALSTYCYINEDVLACCKRYVESATLRIFKERGAILKNDDTVTALDSLSGKAGKAGKTPGPGVAVDSRLEEKKDTRKSQTPEFKKWEEIKKQREADDQAFSSMGRAPSQDVNDYMTAIDKDYKPADADFAKAEPGGGTHTKIARDKDGKISIGNYKKGKDGKAEADSLYDSAKISFLKEEKNNKKLLQDKLEAIRAKSGKGVVITDKEKDKEFYTKARNLLVDVANKDMKGATRNPAAASSPTGTPAEMEMAKPKDNQTESHVEWGPEDMLKYMVPD